jgi:hypothetical protein
MAWTNIDEDDVLTVVSHAELTAFRSTSLRPSSSSSSAQADPLAPVIAQVVDLVRGYVAAHRRNRMGAAGTVPARLLPVALDLIAIRIGSRVGKGPEEVRAKQRDNAMSILEKVAAGQYGVDQPDGSEADPLPSIEARDRQFRADQQDGI